MKTVHDDRKRNGNLPILCGSILLLAALAGPVRALEPPTPAQLEQYRRDGTLSERIAAAEALGNHRVDPEVAARAANRLDSLRQQALGYPIPAAGEAFTPPPGLRGMPTVGTVNVLALLIDFSDYPAYNSAASVGTKLFGNGEGGFPYESLRNYYQRSSYNKLDLRGNVLGWYRPAYPRTSVEQTKLGREALIKEALAYYDLQGHDFSQYDNDNNGAIDYLIVIWTGPHGEWSSFWWGYMTYYSDPVFRLDGKRLGNYSWQWESYNYPDVYNPLVVIHETGHALGLPDLYDYAPGLGPDGGVGELDMMDGNWGDHNCFSKFLLDWITPTVTAAGNQAVSLHLSGTSSDAHIVMPGAVAGQAFGEFFMVQNRTRAGNDITQPGDGLLIWHVDARLSGSGRVFLYDNSYTEHKLVRLMEADGLEEIETGNGVADPGDYYRAGQSFGPATLPGSDRYDGTTVGMNVTAISATGDPMSFQVFDASGDTSPPQGSPSTPVDGGSVTVSTTFAFSWTKGTAADPESGIGGYDLQVGTAPGGADTFDGRVGNILTRAVTGGENGKTYYARVRAVNGAGLPGDWSGNSDGITVALGVLSVTPANQSAPAAGGTVGFTVSNLGSTPISYSSEVVVGQGWLTIQSGATGGDSGTIQVECAANPDCPRLGTIRVTAAGAGNGPVDVTVNQAGQRTPVLFATPLLHETGPGSGTTTFTISNTGCGTFSYSASVTSGAGWLAVTGGATGGNTGTLLVSFSANLSGAARVGKIRVSAAGAAGSPLDLTVTQAAPPVPLPPADLQAGAVSCSRIDLAWVDTGGNETGLRLQRRAVPAGNWSEIAFLPAGATSHSDTDLPATSSFCYRVLAVNASGESAPSNEACAATFTYDAVIPAVAHTQGAAGTNWRSDLDLLNLGDAEAPVYIALLLKDQGNPAPQDMIVTVPPGDTLRIPDVLGTLFQASNAALGLRFGNGLTFANSRFYNISANCGGTFGMYIPAATDRAALPGDGQTVGVFHHLSYSLIPGTGFRTNIGFASDSPFDVIVRIRLFGDQGELLDEMTQPLHPYEHRQITKIHEYLNTPAVDHGSATVEVLTAGGRVHAYAMLIDNLSGDPIYMPAEHYRPSADMAGVPPVRDPQNGLYDAYIPAAAHTGSGSFQWISDVDILNMSATQALVQIDVLLMGQSNLDPATVAVPVPPGQTCRLRDILGSTFHAGNAALGLRFDPTSIFVNSRFYNTGSACSGGTYGMYIPARSDPDVLAGDGVSIGVFHLLSYSPVANTGFRTNIGFANACQLNLNLEIRLFGDTGQQVGIVNQSLRPYEHMQLTKIHQLVNSPAVQKGYATVRVLTPGGRVHVYAMLIDNISSDPLYMPAEIVVY